MKNNFIIKFYDKFPLDWESSSYMENKVYEDENGKYKIRHVTKKVTCDHEQYHGDTCRTCGGDGWKYVTKKEKIYMKSFK